MAIFVGNMTIKLIRGWRKAAERSTRSATALRRLVEAGVLKTSQGDDGVNTFLEADLDALRGDGPTDPPPAVATVAEDAVDDRASKESEPEEDDEEEREPPRPLGATEAWTVAATFGGMSPSLEAWTPSALLYDQGTVARMIADAVASATGPLSAALRAARIQAIARAVAIEALVADAAPAAAQAAEHAAGVALGALDEAALHDDVVAFGIARAHGAAACAHAASWIAAMSGPRARS